MSHSQHARHRRGAPLRLLALCALLALLAGCARPTPTVTPTAGAATQTPVAAAAPRAEQIRFGLVGTLKGSNAWALFDSAGYSYNDFAIRSGYWPRLYHLALPEGQFEPLAAAGNPGTPLPEATFYRADVPLRTDLKWTDGTPFTADDVAFTANTALAFELGLQWQAAYDPAWLERVDAVDAHTVRFVFRQQPDVAHWQYGALQGPILQKAYWQPKVKAAAALLPTGDDLSRIDALTASITDLQGRLQKLIAEGATATGERARQVQNDLQHLQGDLDQARNDLAKVQARVDAALQAARTALYGLDAASEPTLGTWMSADAPDSTYINETNPKQPFGPTSFEKVAYNLYPTEADALAALGRGEINLVLEPGGISPSAAQEGIPGAQVMSNASYSARFIVINPARGALADPALRRALSCSIDRTKLVRDADALALLSFFPGAGPWSPAGAPPVCGESAVELLKQAGYSWDGEPNGTQAGSGLRAPSGGAIPRIRLLAPAASEDAQQAQAALVIQQSAAYLGLTVDIQPASASDIRFALYYSHDYDMAIAGWRLSAYPGYLCEWFGPGNPFGYSSPDTAADCAKLAGTSDLAAAQQRISSIEARLANDPAFIPLYTGRAYDAYRGIVYPFDHLLGGLGAAYGAPALAQPGPP